MKINLEELAKSTIENLQDDLVNNDFSIKEQKESEQNNALKNSENQVSQTKKQLKFNDNPSLGVDSLQENVGGKATSEQTPLFELEQVKTADDAVLILKDEFKKSEKAFLGDIKERILVLFCALEQDLATIKSNENNDENKIAQIENRLKITIEFLEFLLANIEDRIK